MENLCVGIADKFNCGKATPSFSTFNFQFSIQKGIKNMVLNELYEIIKERKSEPQEGSYTSYLFEKGLDKILKKVGEECTETIIASKGTDKNEVVLEICDLSYHLLVLLAELDVDIKDVEAELQNRREKIGNLKNIRKTDKNT
jgi:phosphoribosyl-ATP pyrophosphohydrolase